VTPAGGQLIRETRARYGLTQEELGAMIGYDRSMVSNMENGRRGVQEVTLAQACDKLKDVLMSARICQGCTAGGFLAGVVVPMDLDGHPAEIHDVIEQEYKEFDATYHDYLETRRVGTSEQMMKAADKMMKQLFDLVPLTLSIAVGVNRECGTYHRDALRKVNCSVNVLTKKRKDRFVSAY
jgi:transcriptional regulator with XRE-family HTH domain